MKNVLKIVVPLVLGFAAAVFNFMSLSASSRTTNFIVAKTDIEPFDEFTPDLYDKAPVPARFADTIRRCAVLYSDRGVLSGQHATRKIKEGSLIFYRDAPTLPGALVDLRSNEEAALPVSLEGIRTPPSLMRVGDWIEFRVPSDLDDPASEGKWIGPFRLVSVGTTITRDPDPDEGHSIARHVSVAFPTGKQGAERAMFEELMKFIDRSRVDNRIKLIAVRSD